jgi:hypothetical protein
VLKFARAAASVWWFSLTIRRLIIQIILPLWSCHCINFCLYDLCSLKHFFKEFDYIARCCIVGQSSRSAPMWVTFRNVSPSLRVALSVSKHRQYFSNSSSCGSSWGTFRKFRPLYGSTCPCPNIASTSRIVRAVGRPGAPQGTPSPILTLESQFCGSNARFFDDSVRFEKQFSTRLRFSLSEPEI